MKPKRTILCVDDNEQSLSYRKIMLETRGYRVASYSRGEEALDRFKQGGIDLVVTDMAMPGLDGPQLIAASQEPVTARSGNSHFEQGPHLRSRIASRRVPGPGNVRPGRSAGTNSVCFWCASADPSAAATAIGLNCQAPRHSSPGVAR
jgi:hypothetical protein